MTRLEGWESRLLAALALVRGWQYRQGETDCITMTCFFIREITGADLWPRWGGRYHDPRGALRQIIRAAEYQKPYLQNAISHVLGVEPAPPVLARRGDVVAFEDAHVGIALHTEAVSFGPNGIFYWPIAECDRCWRVG